MPLFALTTCVKLSFYAHFITCECNSTTIILVENVKLTYWYNFIKKYWTRIQRIWNLTSKCNFIGKQKPKWKMFPSEKMLHHEWVPTSIMGVFHVVTLLLSQHACDKNMIAGHVGLVVADWWFHQRPMLDNKWSSMAIYMQKPLRRNFLSPCCTVPWGKYQQRVVRTLMSVVIYTVKSLI